MISETVRMNLIFRNVSYLITHASSPIPIFIYRCNIYPCLPVCEPELSPHPPLCEEVKGWSKGQLARISPPPPPNLYDH